MLKSVLIVDDSAFVRQALREIFEREGDFEVCGEAENGRDAIDAAKRLKPDLVILDLSMPVMNGIDAAKVLKSLAPNLPLVLYSSVTGKAVESLARSVGISVFVSKSESVSVLINKARDILYRAAA